MAEIVPFFATETEHKAVDTLPTDTVPLDSVIKAVPKFNQVVKDNLLAEWRVAGDVLTYHFYKRDRKKLFEETEELMRTLSTDEAKNALATEANAAFEKIPWNPGFEEKLSEALTEYFKGSSGKMEYFPEVDSWSVSLPTGPLWSENFIVRFIYHFGFKIGEVYKWPCGTYIGLP
jgi:hypothetical protein